MRHLKTVRTHLLWLVRHNKISSEENGVDYTQGLTEQVWRSLYHKGQVSLKVMTVKKYTFTCIVKIFCAKFADCYHRCSCSSFVAVILPSRMATVVT